VGSQFLFVTAPFQITRVNYLYYWGNSPHCVLRWSEIRVC